MEEKKIIQTINKYYKHIVVGSTIFAIICLCVFSYYGGLSNACVNSGGQTIKTEIGWECVNISVRQLEIQNDEFGRFIGIKDKIDFNITLQK